MLLIITVIDWRKTVWEEELGKGSGWLEGAWNGQKHVRLVKRAEVMEGRATSLLRKKHARINDWGYFLLLSPSDVLCQWVPKCIYLDSLLHVYETSHTPPNPQSLSLVQTSTKSVRYKSGIATLNMTRWPLTKWGHLWLQVTSPRSSFSLPFIYSSGTCI